ncbi:PaaI family thioesterase [Cumulibacter soli]|uniref:PaaI family thioesterase n=1 Tax=Cumulibacter soli TaxID=2546344 RepID=UPI001ABB7151|nr:PaaI family thioesterase [Cumulibacter soli]
MTHDEKATEQIRSLMPLCATLGVQAVTVSAEKAVLTLEWREDLCTSNGMIHGGTVMALADASGAACAVENLPEDAAGTSTIESKTNFLGAVRGGTLVATSTPLHVGRTTIVVETELRNGDKLVGKTTQTQTVLRPK